jgi:hypothetical protein
VDAITVSAGKCLQCANGHPLQQAAVPCVFDGDRSFKNKFSTNVALSCTCVLELSRVLERYAGNFPLLEIIGLLPCSGPVPEQTKSVLPSRTYKKCI